MTDYKWRLVADADVIANQCRDLGATAAYYAIKKKLGTIKDEPISSYMVESLQTFFRSIPAAIIAQLDIDSIEERKSIYFKGTSGRDKFEQIRSEIDSFNDFRFNLRNGLYKEN